MHPAERETLQEATSYLHENLSSIQALLDQLQTQQVLDVNDCLRINAEIGDERKLVKFLDILQCKESNSSFSQLLKALVKTDNKAADKHLQTLEKTTTEQYGKLKEQLPGWIRANYTEENESVTEIQQLVSQVKGQLFSGLSDRCITSLMSETLTSVFPSARIEHDLRRSLRVAVNVIAISEQSHQKKAPSENEKTEHDSSHAPEQRNVKTIERKGVSSTTTETQSKNKASKVGKSSTEAMNSQSKELAQGKHSAEARRNQECLPDVAMDSQKKDSKEGSNDSIQGEKQAILVANKPSTAELPPEMAQAQPRTEALTAETKKMEPNHTLAVQAPGKEQKDDLQTSPSKPSESLAPESEVSCKMSTLDLRSHDFVPQPQGETREEFHFKEMSAWMTDDVCAWLATIQDLECSVIEQFRKERIKGKFLRKMTEAKMKEVFPEMAMGDIMEILEQRDSFQPLPKPMRTLPSADGRTVHIDDLFPSAAQENTKPPVQCTSHQFALDCFIIDKKQLPEKGQQEVPATEKQHHTKNADPNNPPLAESVDSSTDETTFIDNSEETPFKQPVDPQETPVNAPVDLYETPLKVPVDARETPLKQSKDPLETPLKQPVDARETPLKQPVDRQETPPQLPAELTAPLRETEIQDLRAKRTEGTQEQDYPYPVKVHSECTEQKQDGAGAAAGRSAGLDECETPLKQAVDTAPQEMDDKEAVSRCRPFDAQLGLKTYTRDSRLVCSDNAGPIFHKFVHSEVITTRRERVAFAKQIVQFLCACLNERCNGTIHFGIIGEVDDREADDREAIERTEQIGTIKGVEICTNGDHSEFEAEFKKCLRKCFAPDQIDLVFRCISPLQFIPVVPKEKVPGQPQLYVIELDVLPASDLCAQEAFFAKLPSYQKKKVAISEQSSLYRCFDGNIHACSAEELHNYMEHKNRIVQDRKKKEEEEMRAKEKLDERQEELNSKLRNLMCRGEDNISVDTYPILVMNKPPEAMSKEEMQNKLSFLARVPFKITFDFDEAGTVSEYIDNVEKKPIKVISTADDFSKNSDANLRSPDRLRSLQDDIRNSAIQSWVFVNGHRKDRKTPYEWKMQNQEGFRDAVRFFQEEIPKQRALVVFLLLSEDQDVMIEAAEGLITSFQNQWMVISESEELADGWAKELVRRHCIDEKTWKNKSIIGMPLLHICESVNQMQGPLSHQDPMVATSTGGHLRLKSAGDSYPDLDVLSALECENDIQPLAKFEEQKEKEYYKGGPVDWWNFHYKHVLDRSNLHDLKRRVEKALRGHIEDEDHHVGRFSLYHQAGSGGTSLAMNALWDFRKDYRCAVVHTISDAAKTAQQILNLRQYGETTHPKPILILLDNLEEEKTSFLLAELETKAKQIARENIGKNSVVCVLINCIRRNDLPKPNKNNRILLRHELEPREKDWFKKRYCRMEKRHLDEHGIDPKLLISFNIMKENFNEGFMKKTVSSLLADLEDDREKKLFKYVALLNAFDIESQAIPTAAFDLMMSKTPWQRGPRYGKGAIDHRWETNLSTAAKVLLNVTKQLSMGYIQAIQIVSPLLSKHILEAIKRDQPVKQTFSDMAMEFFSNPLFNAQSVARDNLLKIVKKVLKNRARNANGQNETYFAPIIQRIVDKEDVDKAGEVMERGFELTKDPFIAQQLARLYIYASNWKRAKHFAKLATDTKSDSSYLWDTFGRVFLKEMMEHYQHILATERPLQPDQCAAFVDCAFSGMEIFKKEQKQSLDEKYSISTNSAGYFGELEITYILLDCLSYVQAFDTKNHMKQFLVEPGFRVSAMDALDEESNGTCTRLKGLAQNCHNAIARLEDECIQLREDHIDEYMRSKYALQTMKKLDKLKVHLNPYFGEESDEPPSHFSEEEQCRYRARRLFRLGANSMMRIFDLKCIEKGEDKMKQIKEIVSHNIKTQYETADDLQILICTNLALVQMSPKHLNEIAFEDMVQMSQRLYAKRGTRNFIHLEPYLFYIMLNWPQKVYRAPQTAQTVRSTTSSIKPINHRMFTDTLYKWKEAYFEKYPKQRDERKPYRKKDAIIFFFANGSGMRSIISQDALREKETDGKRESFWKLPKVHRELKRFEGILLTDGEEVQLTIEYDSGNKDTIKFPTSFPITNRSMWNKKVYFVIAFSWRGPKAYDLSTDDPTSDPKYLVKGHRHDHGVEAYPKPMPRGGDESGDGSGRSQGIEPHADYLVKLHQFTRQLDDIQELKSRQEEALVLSQEELTLIRQEDQIRRAWRHLVDQRMRAVERNRKDLNDFCF